jgi:hypothetical protein
MNRKEVLEIIDRVLPATLKEILAERQLAERRTDLHYVFHQASLIKSRRAQEKFRVGTRT